MRRTISVIRLKECAEPGCHELTIHKYCDKHAKLHKRSSEAETKSKFAYMYWSTRWKQESEKYLEEHPFCEICGKPSYLVHHKIEHKGDKDLFWDKNNWQALCNSCHSKIHMTETNKKSKGDK